MNVESFVKALGVDFFTGVPDSQLKALCDYLMERYGIDPAHHIIGANEGNCAALAAGYQLATGKIPAVYLQNSGEGNIINPLASLLNEKVYAIPEIFIIGWRGEPGVHDEPQHVYQGEVTLTLLEAMKVPFFVLDRDTTTEQLAGVMQDFSAQLAAGRDVAFVVRKGALSYDGSVSYTNKNPMTREEIIRRIVQVSGDDPIVSTTGKASRELFEIREGTSQDHVHDFLTVGSMGHSSSIALGIALNRPDRRVWCIDGDGAALMHLGALAVIGSCRPKNLIHVVINNGAHESVGGMPTVAASLSLTDVARACGYPRAVCVSTREELDRELAALKAVPAAGSKAVADNGAPAGTDNGPGSGTVSGPDLTFMEVRCAIGARADLGRPAGSPLENKRCFMDMLAAEPAAAR